MCGICGFIDSAGGLDPQGRTRAVREMAGRLVHRGPDDSGTWTDPDVPVALGHRRLSILDLSPLGHQPMSSATGRFVLVLNGEIYNFPDLRERLGSMGHRFHGHSDTEVLLAAFEEWGVAEATRRAVGMFAFAVWDREERRLLLARDRMGEKPLYYGWCGRSFLFGSELKALRAHPGWRGTISRDALAAYFRFSYVPAPLSIYQEIRKLTPGTILTIDPARPGFTPEPVAFWDAYEEAVRAAADPFAGSEAEAVDELEARLRQAVRQQMVADVPLGAFLSGGVDSSTVVALMQSMSGRPVKTFTIGFHEAEFNEAHHALAVARHLGTDHTELYVTPDEAMAVIPSLHVLYDEPFSDSSQIPTHLVSRLARRHVTVSLSGDGGDELFGGYNRYFLAPRIWNSVSRVPRLLRRAVAGAVDTVPWSRAVRRAGPFLPRPAAQARLDEKMRKVAKVLRAADSHAVFRSLVSVWEDPAVLVRGGSEGSTLVDRPGSWPTVGGFVQQMMYVDALTYLPDDILVKVDRAAMAVALETRVPFLDHRVVEFAWRLPLGLKLRDGQGKWLLRQLLYRHVPPSLIERPKMGFGIPLGRWMRGPLRGWAEELMDERRLRQEGILEPRTVRAVWQGHQAGEWDAQLPLWGILMFESWLESTKQVQAAAA